MNYSLRSLTALTLGIATVSFAMAGTWPYKSVKGVQELTGQLIVRPLQIDAMMAKNFPLDKVQTTQARAKDRFKLNTIRYYKVTDEFVVRVPAGKDDNSYAKELLDSGDYEYVCPNWKVYPSRVPNDPRYNGQWHHPKIGSPLAWNLWTGSSSFYVTFVDTGITKTHEDLKNLIVPGYNSVDRKTEAEGGDISDINGHGTHVSGCGAAQGNNGIGVSGVGWNFKIRFVKTSNAAGGGAFTDDMMAGARWAVEQGSKTISVSYAGVDAEVIGTTGTYVKSKGGLLLYAAGNDNRNLTGFSYPDTIVVGASDENDGKASFSAYGKGVSVFAPGTNILSTTFDGAYGLASGTSMATPVCNGALATIWSVNPSLTPDEAQQILYNTCDNIGSSSIFGKGRINVFKGVQLALATLAKDTVINSVGVQIGTHAAGNLGSVQDQNLDNAYKVNSSTFGALGTIAATNLGCKVPTDQGKITSFSFSTNFKVTGSKPTSVMAYILNNTTNNYDLVATKGAYPEVSTALSFRLTSDASKYISGDGSVKLMLRSVVPSRFGTTSNQLVVQYAKARYSAQPSF